MLSRPGKQCLAIWAWCQEVHSPSDFFSLYRDIPFFMKILLADSPKKALTTPSYDSSGSTSNHNSISRILSGKDCSGRTTNTDSQRRLSEFHETGRSPATSQMLRKKIVEQVPLPPYSEISSSRETEIESAVVSEQALSPFDNGFTQPISMERRKVMMTERKRGVFMGTNNPKVFIFCFRQIRAFDLCRDNMTIPIYLTDLLPESGLSLLAI